mmetsp:Transcript_1706/g.2451  ORF Transcript_1706/g.2451 Transcript_1706/m.2451 type:complete len:294 (-) Transcript_1706:8-889(-)
MASNNNEESKVVISKIVELEKSGGNAIIVSINRPEQLNCFDAEVVRSLAQLFSSIADKVIASSGKEDDGADANSNIPAAVIFTGEGSSFCAGADLSNPPNPLEQSSDLFLANNPVHQMGRIGIPVIGALRGHVITGGFELALSCDILVGEPSTKFRDTHVKFGLAPCWGLSQKLQKRIGPGRAKLVSYTARPITAELAYSWGLLDELVPEGISSLDRSIEIADSIACNNGTMAQRYKMALEEGSKMNLANGLQRERELALSHYIQAMNDGVTFQNAKEFISGNKRREEVTSRL